MRKNKGLFLVLATLLAVTCLLVSCNSEVSENATGGGDKLVYATFGKGNTKALTGTTISTSYKLEEIGDVYWFYKASKADQGGRSGAQSAWYPVIPGQKGLDGVIGPFSTGLWNFEVIAYKDCSTTAPTSPETSDASVTVGETTYYMNTAVFAGSVNGVSLATGTQANPDPINVTVTLQTSGSNGALTLDRDFVFEWAPGGGGTTDLTLKAVYGTGASDYKTVTLKWDSTSSKYVISSESETQWAFAAGDYEFDFEVYYTLNNVQYTVATVSDVALKVYGGQETIIKASILEGNFVYAKINATVKSTAVANTVTTDASTTFVTSYTPASVSSGFVSSTEVTTVEFPANALKATGTTVTEGYTVTSYALDVAVTDIDASQESTFTVADTTQENVVASIDLTLTMTQTSTTSSETTTITVSSFDNDGVAAVTTYIAKNLTEPVVYYDGEPFTASTTGAANTYTYDSTSGRLVIYTDHFSEFYVSSKDEAYNATTGTAYATVKGAVDAAVANQTIKLLKNCTSTDEALAFDDSGVVFDLNGKTLTVVRTGSTKSIQVTSDVTFKNGAIVGNLPSTTTSSNAAVYVLANGDLTIEDVDITVNSNVNNESHYAVAIFASGAKLAVKDGEFNGLVGTNGMYRNDTLSISGGTFNEAVYFPAHGTYTISGGTFNKAVEIKSGSLTVSGGEFNYADDPQVYTPYWNGTTVTGCSLAAVAYNGVMTGTEYGPSPSVTITGGTFAGKIGLARASYAYSYPTLTGSDNVVYLGVDEVATLISNDAELRAFLSDTTKHKGKLANDVSNPNVSTKSTRYVYAESRDVELDLAGFTLDGYEVCVRDGSTLTLTGNGIVNLEDEEAVVIYNGDLVLAGATISGNPENSAPLSFLNDGDETVNCSLIIADDTVNYIETSADGGSGIMVLAWSADMNLNITGQEKHNGQLLVTAKTADAWAAIRPYQGGANSSTVIDGLYIELSTESETYEVIDGTGDVLIKTVTGSFSGDVSEHCQAGYWSKLNSTTGRYEIELLTEEDASFRITSSTQEEILIAGSIYQAMALATENSIITVLKDCNITETAWNAPGVGADCFTIDLNGKTISGNDLSIKRPDPRNSNNVTMPVHVTIKNGTMSNMISAYTYSYLTVENIEFTNTTSSYGSAIKINSNIKTNVYDWAEPGTNSLTVKNCSFDNKNINLYGANEGQKIDLTMTNCTMTKTLNSNDSMIKSNYYVYGTISLEDCSLNGNFNNSYTYPVEIGSTSSSNGGNDVVLNLNNVSIAVTGSSNKPVSIGSSWVVNVSGTNTFTVDGNSVDYKGSALN